MKKLLLGITVLLFIVTACNGQNEGKETEVVLETTMGDIRIKLYNDTPVHRDNFIRNVKAGKYDNASWHRIIRNFMIQTGEQNDKSNAHDGDSTATDTLGWLQAEIVYPKHFHKRGMVGAAREGDDINPKKKSDPAEFYIVTGRTYLDTGLSELEEARTQQAAERLYNEKLTAHAAELDSLRRARDRNGVSNLLEKLLDDAKYETSKNPPLPYNQEQRRAYRTSGGAPWLDGEYTIFGEVVEGMKTVLAIERVKTDGNDRPLTEVKVIKAYVVE